MSYFYFLLLELDMYTTLFWLVISVFLWWLADKMTKYAHKRQGSEYEDAMGVATIIGCIGIVTFVFFLLKVYWLLATLELK